MNKCINYSEFLRQLIDDERLVKQGAEIMKGLLEAQSPRLTNISEKMEGRSERGYKMIQRFLKKVNLKRLLLRCFCNIHGGRKLKKGRKGVQRGEKSEKNKGERSPREGTCSRKQHLIRTASRQTVIRLLICSRAQCDSAFSCAR
jgi:hypothetical protein